MCSKYSVQSHAAAVSATCVNLEILIEWTEGFDFNETAKDTEVRCHLKLLPSIQMRSLSKEESSSAAKLVEIGCQRAAANFTWLLHSADAEFFFSGLCYMVQQGLAISETRTDSTLQNAIKVCNISLLGASL